MNMRVLSQQLEMGIIEAVPQAELCTEPNYLIMVWCDSRRKLQNYVLCLMAPQRQN